MEDGRSGQRVALTPPGLAADTKISLKEARVGDGIVGARKADRYLAAEVRLQLKPSSKYMAFMNRRPMLSPLALAQALGFNLASRKRVAVVRAGAGLAGLVVATAARSVAMTEQDEEAREQLRAAVTENDEALGEHRRRAALPALADSVAVCNEEDLANNGYELVIYPGDRCYHRPQRLVKYCDSFYVFPCS